MLASIAAWFGSMKAVATTVAAVIGFMKWLGDVLQSRADRAAGRSESEAAQSKEGLRVETRIAEEAAKPLDEDDAIKRMREGGA